MKKKFVSLLLALTMLLTLSACGEKGGPELDDDSSFEEELNPIIREEDTAAPEEEPAPAEMTYTFENGTLTCSGNGIIMQGEWIPAVKNALFETNESVCLTEVKTLVIEQGVTGIAANAFSGCINLGGELVIPDSVVQIGNWAFGAGDRTQSSNALTRIVIPDSVTEIGDGAFMYCQDLTSVSISKNLAIIPPSMFRGCSSLSSVEIPEGVTHIGNIAFSGCPIEEITIPDSVTSLGEDPFAGTSITEITIPASVTEWGSESLTCGPYLKDITILCEATMDNIDSLLGRFLGAYFEIYMIDLSEGRTHPPITIHAPSGSVVAGYVNRQIEYYEGAFAFEAI